MNTGHLIKIMLLGVVILFNAQSVMAASSQEIDIKVDGALERFHKEVKGSDQFLKKVKGVVIFPEVVNAGLGVGGEYGEGSLRINGSAVDYYNTAAASIGLQFGEQMKTVILVFFDAAALDKFRNSDGWEVGVDGSVALVEFGAGKDIKSVNINDPVVGFMISTRD